MSSDWPCSPSPAGCACGALVGGIGGFGVLSPPPVARQRPSRVERRRALGGGGCAPAAAGSAHTPLLSVASSALSGAEGRRSGVLRHPAGLTLAWWVALGGGSPVLPSVSS